MKNELIQKINSTFIRHVNADAIRVQRLNHFKKKINETYLAFSETSLDYSTIINHLQNKLRVHALKLGVEEPKLPELKNKHNEEYIRQGLSSIMSSYSSEIAQYEKNKRIAIDLKKKFNTLCSKIFKESEDKLAGYIHLKGGSFIMGNNKGPSDQRPEHQVTIAPFYMKSTPVTQREWREVMGFAYKHCLHIGDNLPVEHVSFIDAVAYCNAMSQGYGLRSCYKYNSKTNDVSIDYSANGFRLPTEAEWEYAAKTVEETELFDRAWYSENSGDSTQAVAGRYENRYGLYDMLGNVYEWVNDFYAHSYQSTEMNPHGPSKGKQRVVRGGCYNSNSEVCTATARNSLDSKDNRLCVGFRPVLNDCNFEAFPYKQSIWKKIKALFNN
jgi:formylglycine-generating enzyme required for sulfatase activity